MAMRKRDDDEVFPNAAGIDVGGSSHWVAVPRHLAERAGCEPVREFGPMTDDLNAMADWLLACGVDTVALESTGVYWIPVYEVLERRGLTVWLVDARQMKYVPGRKSDVQDCQWLQKLMSLGLLRAAWRPGDEVCVARRGPSARSVAHRAGQLGAAHAEGAGADEPATQRGAHRRDGHDWAGHRAGERDAKTLARHRHGRVKASEHDIERALSGNWREEHLFVLGQALAMVDSLAQRVLECEAKIEALLAPLGRHEVELGGPGKRRGKNTPEFDARTALARWAGVDLTRINGLAVTTVMTILSEIGPDLGRFANVKHFCSWLGLCPGTKVSGGKVLSARTRRSTNRVRQAAEAGGDEPVTQRLRARRLLPAAVRAHGQAARQYRRRPQAGADGLLHADPRRSLRRSGPAAL
ncbi:IS110 family transposase [Cupriavidus sp. D39]|uniref:IS110 family transposase n=1 Tax=Cupriavidus sp. D39 TaxID=2997877 RepID=UPI00226ED56E|nr:IS110 family transposase [Cupriavidus sp. D39]MCY0853164.1 IS110 family transposase [Cupriavidus sp. D39]